MADVTNIAPDPALIIWILAAVALVGLVLFGMYQLAKGRLVTPLHRGALFVCVITLVWVWPGVIAALVLFAGIALQRLPAH